MKRACLLMLQKGLPAHPVLERRVDLLPTAARIYAAFWELDRSEFGSVVPSSMFAVLDEYGWTDRDERQLIRSIWRSMARADSEVREEQREKETERRKREKAAAAGGSRKGRRRRATVEEEGEE